MIMIKQNFIRLFFLSLSLSLAGQLFAQKFEAEDAEFSGEFKTNTPGYSGTGFIDLRDPGNYVKFAINFTTGGTHKLYLGYGNPYDTDKDIYVKVNGEQKEVTLPIGTTCQELLVGEYTFLTGNNVIEIIPHYTWFLIDYIFIEGGNGTTTPITPPSPVEGFKVDGAKLLDANDKEFVMRGTNMAWTWFKGNGMAQLEAIARAGANTVRIVLANGWQFNPKDDAATVANLYRLH